MKNDFNPFVNENVVIIISSSWFFLKCQQKRLKGEEDKRRGAKTE